MSQGCLGVVYFYDIFQVIMMPPCIAPKTEVKVKEFMLESGEDNTGSWIILNVNGIFLGGNCCPSGNNQDSFHCPTDLRKFKMVSLVVWNSLYHLLLIFVDKHQGGGRRICGRWRDFGQDGTFRGEQKQKAWNVKENKTALTYFSSDKSSRGQSQSVSSVEVSCYDHIDDTHLMIFTKEVSSTNWIP